MDEQHGAAGLLEPVRDGAPRVRGVEDAMEEDGRGAASREVLHVERHGRASRA
jgi:hypothetical protein